MSLLNLKSYRFPILCIVFFVGLTTALAQETLWQDTAEDELDLKTLLAAIKQHDALLKSGEGEVVYTLGVPPFVDTDTSCYYRHHRLQRGKDTFRFGGHTFPLSQGKTTTPYAEQE